MNENMVRQYELKQVNGNANIIVWLNSTTLKTGNRVRLHNQDETWWDVLRAFSVESKKELSRKRKWGQGDNFDKHKSKLLS